MTNSTYYLLVFNMYIAGSLDMKEFSIALAFMNGILAFSEMKKERELEKEKEGEE